MLSQRSSMRRRTSERVELCPPSLPKRMRHSTRSPSACQKVISRQPKSDGSSQFHKCITISPPMKINSGIVRIASGAIQIIFFHFLFMFSPSRFRKFVVDTLQALAQIQYGVAFAREQRIHAYPGFLRHFLKAAPFQFMANKHYTLLLGQLADGQ